MSVSEFLKKTSSTELTEWVAYHELKVAERNEREKNALLERQSGDGLKKIKEYI